MADLDSDGHPDAVLTNSGKGVAISKGAATGAFAPITQIALSINLVNVVRVAEVNADGMENIVGTYTSGLFVVPDISGGTFGAPLIASSTTISDLAFGDLDQDGQPEIVAAREQGFVDVYDVQTGALNLKASASTDPSLTAVTVTDLNNDGLLDIAATYASMSGFVDAVLNQSF